VSSPNLANYNSGYNSSFTDDLNAANDARNTSQQRRQIAAQQKAQTLDAAFKPLKEVIDSRAKIRAQMVQKYNVEF
jgi:hypothetical protein